MYTCIQSFESVACHLELAILSRKFRITERAQSSAVEYFSFSQQNSLEVFQDLHFHQVMGIMPKISNLLRFYDFQNNTS